MNRKSKPFKHMQGFSVFGFCLSSLIGGLWGLELNKIFVLRYTAPNQ
jgi:hypothetical protein